LRVQVRVRLRIQDERGGLKQRAIKNAGGVIKNK
jgi:hypothetical protein